MARDLSHRHHAQWTKNLCYQQVHATHQLWKASASLPHIGRIRSKLVPRRDVELRGFWPACSKVHHTHHISYFLSYSNPVYARKSLIGLAHTCIPVLRMGRGEHCLQGEECAPRPLQPWVVVSLIVLKLPHHNLAASVKPHRSNVCLLAR